jgi:phosphotransferase system  glucose/maltose/N-acetylglucosamine-specific IIC component
MKKIGYAASRIAKGNFYLYNLYVVLLASLFSLFIFVIVGATVIFALTLLRYISEELLLVTSQTDWTSVFIICMAVLTVIVAIFDLLLIFYNIKLRGKEKF